MFITDQRLAHMVFFTLKDASEPARLKMVEDCREYLDGQPGVLHFSAGMRGEEFDRPVNDAVFHVALHVVFENKAAHDAYQSAPRHIEFIERNKANWEQVRVFDSYVG